MNRSWAFAAMVLAIVVAGGAAHAAPPAGLPEGTAVHENLSYGPHERNVLDLFVPPSDKPVPLVIYVHGGAWLGGDKREGRAASQLVKDGFAVAAINYRLSQHAIFPAQIQDAKAAVRWLRDHATQYNLDPNRFGAWGASAGGHIVALLGTAQDVPEFGDVEGATSSRVQAVADWFGPANLLTMGEQAPSNSMIDHDAPDAPEGRLVGGAVRENKEAARNASPVTHVSGDEPPFLILHGGGDPLVPWQQSQELTDALTKAGANVTLQVIKGAGHGNGFEQARAWQTTRQFFIDQLHPEQR